MIAVVGGGVAGIAAAVRLAEAGRAVVLFEARGELGGRARSYRDKKAGEELDVGRHIVMRATSEILDLYRALGVAGEIVWHEEIPFVTSDGRRATLGTSPWGLAKFDGLSLRDRWALARAALSARLRSRRGIDGARYLDELGLFGEARALVDLLVVSALNAEPRDCAAEAVRFFLAKALGSGAAGVGVSRVPLSRLYRNVARIVAAAGGEVRTRARVRRVVVEGGRARGVETADGFVEADAVVLAVHPHDVARLLPEELRGTPPFAELARIPTAPIAGVHFLFDRDASDLGADLPFVGLVGRETHWFFVSGRCVSATFSAAHALAAAPREAIVRTAREDLARAFPALADVPHRAAVVTKETRATFVPAPALSRPGTRTPIEGLYLAGDYCDTGWPSTMESAARAGRAAAEAVFA